jgi:hypothetical protein
MALAFPSDEAVQIATEWLGVNEGDDGEAEACPRVAAWLRQQVMQRMVRSAAREAGVPVARLRKALEAES